MANIVVTDLDDTLVLSGDRVNARLLTILKEYDADGYDVIIVSGRQDSRLEETRAWLEANDVPHSRVHLSDFPQGPNASREFKLYKAQKLIEEGDEIEIWYENDADTREGLRSLGIEAVRPPSNQSSKIDDADFVAPEAAQDEALLGLRWREEYRRGGTEIGVARARDISNGRNLSPDTIQRMVSYFARHEVDKQGEGWSRGETGYPSAGRIAWALWGGDPGRAWAEDLLGRIQAERDGLEVDHTEGTDTTKEVRSRMNVKSFPVDTIEVKAIASDIAPHGEFTALVSVFGNTDLVGDRVMPGAFSKSLAAYAAAGKNLPIVWSHDWGNAESFIGKTLSAQETENGLLIRGAFFDTPRAQTVRTLLAERVVNEFSFAYDILNEQKGADGVNELMELNILEAGPTLKGANPATQLIAAKTAVAALEVENAKAGRTLSTKNENLVKQAKNLLEEVLSSLDTPAEPAKSEEPIEVKAEEQGMDPGIAATLIELTELDSDL